MGKKEIHIGVNVLRLIAQSSNILYVSIPSSMESKQYRWQGWPARRASGAAFNESYHYSSSLTYGSNTAYWLRERSQRCLLATKGTTAFLGNQQNH
jgi:hypothetical protein